jgi:hypothetical protein
MPSAMSASLSWPCTALRKMCAAVSRTRPVKAAVGGVAVEARRRAGRPRRSHHAAGGEGGAVGEAEMPVGAQDEDRAAVAGGIEFVERRIAAGVLRSFSR